MLRIYQNFVEPSFARTILDLWSLVLIKTHFILFSLSLSFLGRKLESRRSYFPGATREREARKCPWAAVPLTFHACTVLRCTGRSLLLLLLQAASYCVYMWYRLGRGSAVEGLGTGRGQERKREREREIEYLLVYIMLYKQYIE